MSNKKQRSELNVPDLPAIFSPRDLEQRNFSRDRLRTLIKCGEVSRIGRGLYRLTRIPAGSDANESLAVVCARVPQAVICLLTALRFYEITTQAPRAVWIAIDRKARKPRLTEVPLKIVRFSRSMLRYAVETREILGVPVKITSPARTIVDLFRYRKKIGIDIAIEALRDALQSRRVRPEEIRIAAEAGRMARVIRPYLEAILS